MVQMQVARTSIRYYCVEQRCGLQVKSDIIFIVCSCCVVRGQGEEAAIHIATFIAVFLQCNILHFEFFLTDIVVSGGAVVYYGQNVTLTCVLVDGPPSEFVWEIPSGSTSLLRGMTYDQQNSSTLTFTALENDTGNYTCNALGISDSTLVTVGKPIVCFDIMLYACVCMCLTHVCTHTPYHIPTTLYSASNTEWTNECNPGVQ